MTGKLNQQIFELSEAKLASKVDNDTIKLFKNDQLWKQIVQELQLAIDAYNNLEKESEEAKLLFLNAIHLTSVFEDSLPNYLKVIEKLVNDNSLVEQVFGELTGSDYFQEVWEIDDKKHLFINLMILFYRTSLLNIYPEIREGGAQISSVIEEMAALLEIEGKATELFKAIKHWLIAWEEEGFSKLLAEKVKDI